MARIKHWFWQHGQTYGVLLAPKGRYIASPDNPYILVTDDSENWVAKKIGFGVAWQEIIPDLEEQGIFVRKHGGSRANIQPEWRLPLEWAVREIGKKTWTANITVQTEAQKRATTIVQKLPKGEFASYIGWELIAKQSAHSLASLHRAVEKAVEVCDQAWGWRPENLRIKFHTTGNAFGLAYSPGKKDHIISLLKKMFQEYDMDSAYRVILHELCHHYRDERFRLSPNDHDEIFCRELEKVDPTVEGDPRQCRHFTDVADPALVAKHQRQKNEPVWSPQAGTIQFWHKKSDGTISLYWKPNPGYKWGSWRVSVRSDNILALLKQFSPGEWGKVLVQRHPKSVESYWSRLNPDNDAVIPLLSLVVGISKTFKRVGDVVMPYLAEALNIK